MNMTAKKEALGKYKERLEKRNEREPADYREFANDTATLERVIEKKIAGDPIPTGYTDYPDWEKEMAKQIDTKVKNLEKIQDQKLMIEAIDHFLANAN